MPLSFFHSYSTHARAICIETRKEDLATVWHELHKQYYINCLKLVDGGDIEKSFNSKTKKAATKTETPGNTQSKDTATSGEARKLKKNMVLEPKRHNQLMFMLRKLPKNW